MGRTARTLRRNTKEALVQTLAGFAIMVVLCGCGGGANPGQSPDLMGPGQRLGLPRATADALSAVISP
jgi:hypothetical protein